MPEERSERSHLYMVLQSHGFRALYQTVVCERDFLDWSDEKIAANPATVRAVVRNSIECADKWYQAMMGAWAVSDENLTEFVRVRTDGGKWQALMEKSGMVWNDRTVMWERADA